MLVVPAASHVAHATVRAAVASSHGKASRKALAARRTPSTSAATTPARKAHTSTYHTASLAAKHRASAN
jgi:hypothetical protein